MELTIFYLKIEAIIWPGLYYRGTSIIRKRTHLGPYRRPMPTFLGVSHGGRCLLIGRYPCKPTAGSWRSTYRGMCTVLINPPAVQGYLVYKETYTKETERI